MTQSERKLRLLIVSNTPWDDGNSFGNSYSNIFGGTTHYEIANIYCQAGSPRTRVATRFFQITAKDIVRHALGRQAETGREVSYRYGETPAAATELDARERRGLRFFKLKRWQVLFWARDLIWASRRWRSAALDAFVKDFAPDLVFQPVYYSSYINEIGLHAARLAQVPVVGYISDDNYTLRRFSLSPLFWADRLWKRRYVGRACCEARVLYVISEKQKREYDALFGAKCKVLYKGDTFAEEPRHTLHTPLRLVYTGNIGSGRWKTLAAVARAIAQANAGQERAHLFITTPTPVSRQMAAALNLPGASTLLGCVALEEKERLQREADVLVHVEAFARAERYTSRLSFSTKIVDYLATAHAILAIGWRETAAIEYLLENDAALVVADERETAQTVARLIDEAPRLVPRYGHQALALGRRAHQIDTIRRDLYETLLAVVERRR